MSHKVGKTGSGSADDLDEIRRRLMEMKDRGECSVVNIKDKTVFRLTSTRNRRENADDLDQIIQLFTDMRENGDISVVNIKGTKFSKLEYKKNGQSNINTASIEEIEKAIINGFILGTKRIYRRREDLPDPNSSPTAAVNSLVCNLGARASREHVDLFRRCADKFPNKRKALERAIELLAGDIGLEDGPK